MDYSSHDVAQVKRFYTEVLGFTDFSHQPDYDYLYIRTGPSSSLGFMPPLPGPPEQWRPPREPSICLIVADVDRTHQVLAAKGVAFEQEPADMPWGHRTAVLRDPEGRLLCLAQPLGRPPARQPVVRQPVVRLSVVRKPAARKPAARRPARRRANS